MLLAFGTSFADALTVTWSHPPWATPSQPFEGQAVFEGPKDAQVTCNYRYTETAKGTVPCKLADGDGGAYRFSIPAHADADADELVFWLTVEGSGGQALTSEPVTVPRSEVLELEVSGRTDQELTYPMGDWDAAILFRPCCLIISGWIQAERIPVQPAPSAEGLPSTLLSPYFRIEPDQLVKATGGVNVRASYNDLKHSGVDPESIRPYHWKDDHWTPVFDPILDQKNRRVTFPFPAGGIFVIAGNSSE